MKKGQKWKRVFLHEDGRTSDQVYKLLSDSGLTVYANTHSAGIGFARSRKLEHWIFVLANQTDSANLTLKANDFVFEVA